MWPGRWPGRYQVIYKWRAFRGLPVSHIHYPIFLWRFINYVVTKAHWSRGGSAVVSIHPPAAGMGIHGGSYAVPVFRREQLGMAALSCYCLTVEGTTTARYADPESDRELFNFIDNKLKRHLGPGLSLIRYPHHSSAEPDIS